MVTQDDIRLIGAQLKPIIQAMIDAAQTRPLQVFTTSDKPDPTDRRWLWRPFVLSDGAGNRWVAISNGTTLRYLEGTAV